VHRTQACSGRHYPVNPDLSQEHSTVAVVNGRSIEFVPGQPKFADRPPTQLWVHNWVHVGGSREGDAFVQLQRCERCSVQRRLRFNLIDGRLLGEDQ
jgi:hypothetical protein